MIAWLGVAACDDDRVTLELLVTVEVIVGEGVVTAGLLVAETLLVAVSVGDKLDVRVPVSEAVFEMDEEYVCDWVAETVIVRVSVALEVIDWVWLPIDIITDTEPT